MSKRKLYWVSLVSGWLAYIFLMYLLNRLGGKTINVYFLLNLLTTFTLGIVISNLYRYLIIRLDWLKHRIVQLIPRVLGASLIWGIIYFFSHTLISEVIIGEESFEIDGLAILQTTLNLAVIFMVWSLLYFLFHFIQNYRKEEIKNLKWEAARNEMELNKLKSQLNPHFIFNSMNSIRALVNENPEKSKESITQLSNILRNSLLMGRKKLISFRDEIQLVQDYLNLEKTRYEERLECISEIDSKTLDHWVPPMIVQTLVENGIKHGISKIPNGGSILVEAKLKDDDLIIIIINDGELLNNTDKEVGFGLINTEQRLKLIYGGRAKFQIENIEGVKVKATLLIPKESITYKTDNDESTDN